MPRFRALFTKHVRQKRKVYHDGFVLQESGRPPALTDEAGAVLARAERPVAPLEPDAEGLDAFDGYLVNLDGLDGEDAGAEAVPVALARPPPRKRAVLAAPSFRASRPRASTEKGPGASAPPACPADARRPRTDEEILGLLAGAPPPPPAGPAVAPRRGDAGLAAHDAPWKAGLAAAARPLAARPQPAAAPAARWSAPSRRRPASDEGSGGSDRGPSAAAPSTFSARLRFPDAAATARPASRTVTIPDVFPGGVPQYTSIMRRALEEELELRLHAAARAFRGAVAGAGGRAGALERAVRSAGARFYADAELSVGGPSRGGGGRGPSFLTLRGPKPSNHHKHDLWVLGSDTSLAGIPDGVAGDWTAGPWVAVARALWHGASTDGRVQVELLGPPPAALRRDQPVCALHAGEAATELACLAALGRAGGAPALRALLAPPSLPPPPAATGRFAADAAAHSAASRLNDDQAGVVDAAAAWAAADAAAGARGAAPAVILVHGPFGCGKSSLMVTLTSFLASPKAGDGARGHPPGAPPPGAGLRVLVAAHTNAAVDRVLVGLLDAAAGPAPLRVGPVRRMHRRLLPHSLHSPTAARSDVAVELALMVRAATDPATAAAAADELDRVNAGALERRRSLLASAPIVGATCVSAGALPLDGPPFDVVVIDEASQIAEPLAVLALAAARPRLVIVAGDPAQLPPVIAQPATLAAGRAGSGLARSLLSRLLAAGHGAALLRTQYRCHPAIAAPVNAAFYGGRLIDGVTAADRTALLPGLPPVALVSVPHGVESYGGGRSAANAAEAAAVARVVASLAAAGVPGADVGVIGFFRAQCAAVEGALRGVAGAGASGDQPYDPPTVSTVDSFQGSEKEVIILTTAVTRATKFAADSARLCVALTRARRHLVIVAHPAALRGDDVMGRVAAAAAPFSGWA